jgi:predicted transcriptional regulator
MKPRDKYSLIKDILESLPDNQTRVMCKAGISYSQIKDMFKLLLETGLMRKEDEQYILTDKGEIALYYIDNLALVIK